MTYATSEELAEYMGIIGNVIDRDSNTLLEELGTGDGTKTSFLLKNSGVFSDTLKVYYGSDEDSALSQELTLNTDYTFDSTNERIILTSTGLTTVGTDTIYASYTYNKLGLPESQFTDSINYAESEIFTRTNFKWFDGSQETVDYSQVINEVFNGLGVNRKYFTRYYPIPNLSSTLTSDVTSSDTSIPVDSTSGFPSSGYIGVNNQKIYYTSKTLTSFDGVTLTDDITSGTVIYPYVLELNTASDDIPVWEVISKSEYEYDTKHSNFYLYDDYPTNTKPLQLRATYLYGFSEIPDVLKRLTLMIASKDLMHLAVRKATVTGNDGFKPTLVDVDDKWIELTIKQLSDLGSSNI